MYCLYSGVIYIGFVLYIYNFATSIFLVFFGWKQYFHFIRLICQQIYALQRMYIIIIIIIA